MVDTEPFLADYAVSFHQVFTLIDPAMNTSEIKPIHLAVPRIRGAVRPAAPQAAVSDKPKSDESATGGRYLQHFANPKRDVAPAPATLPNVIAQAIGKPPRPAPPQ
jgi:hypothetical protein